MSKESLDSYRQFVSLDPSYADKSGLFEIIESIYIQLCLDNIYFNAYTRYEYCNVTYTHCIQIFKQIDVNISKIFSQVMIYSCDIGSSFIIIKYNCNDDYDDITKQTCKFDSSTFMIIKDYLKNWFSEILINVKKNNEL